MSRTYRKPHSIVSESKESYIKRNLNLDSRYSLNTEGCLKTRKRRRKSKEVYKKEYEKEAEKLYVEYNRMLKTASYDENGNPYSGYSRVARYRNGHLEIQLIKNYIRKPYVNVSKYYYEEVFLTKEDRISEAQERYSLFSRDGWNNRKTGFKKAATKHIRKLNKQLEHKIMKGYEYEHLSYPNEHDSDYLWWSYW
jgi:hypothetical protein